MMGEDRVQSASATQFVRCAQYLENDRISIETVCRRFPSKIAWEKLLYSTESPPRLTTIVFIKAQFNISSKYNNKLLERREY